jgi:hypothetical protein
VIQVASVLVLAGLILLGVWLPPPIPRIVQPAHPVIHVVHRAGVVPVAPGRTNP